MFEFLQFGNTSVLMDKNVFHLNRFIDIVHERTLRVQFRKLQYPLPSVVFHCLCDKGYHKQEVSFILYFLEHKPLSPDNNPYPLVNSPLTTEGFNNDLPIVTYHVQQPVV